MKNEADIQKTFARFAGREFPLSAKNEFNAELGRDIMTFRISNREDETLNEMVDEAASMGLKMAFNTKFGGYVYGDQPGGSVTAEVSKDAEGKWRVGNTFKLKQP